jgi:hypothetical protein
MNSSNFKDRFSLDYLSPDSNTPRNLEQPTARYAPPRTPQGIEAVLDSLGGQLLSNLKVAPSQTSNLWDLAKASSVRLDALFPVIQHLASKGLIELVFEDPSGNDTYRITPAGETAKL